MEFRKDINGLRAIAVVAVTLYHFSVAGFSGGFVGVDVFFVISGYLMTRIILENKDGKAFSLLNFYFNRARRIVPALAALCFTLAIVGYVAFSSVDYKELARQIYSALGFFSNFLFWMEAGYFDVAAKEKVLLHTWSLSVEWQFYLLYPIYLQVAAKQFRHRSGVIGAIWVAFFLSFACSILGTQFRPLAAFYLLPTRAWEMLMGGLIFAHADQLAKIPHSARKTIELVGLIFICVAITQINSGANWPGYLAFVPVVGTALVLAAAVPRSILTGNIAVQFIGQCSYSIYLWHWPIVVFLRANNVFFSTSVLAAGIALSILMGSLSFRFIEQPFKKMLQRRSSLKQSLVLIGGVFPLMLLAVSIYSFDGFEWRYKGHERTQLRQYEAALNDWGYPSDCGRTDLFGRLRLCKIGGGAPGSVLFIGDSQIEQWWPRFDQKNGQRSGHPIIFATYGGCPPLPHVNRITPGYRCDQFFYKATRLAAGKNISTVVFGSVWTDYFFGAFDSKDKRSMLYVIDDAGKRVVVAPGDDAFNWVFREFSDLMAQLVKSGKRVIIILPIPGRFENISAELYRATWYNRAIPDLSIPRNAFQRYSERVVSRLRDAASAAGAEIIDPLDFLCENDKCPVTAPDGNPLYMDGAHLRPFAVKERASFLDIVVR